MIIFDSQFVKLFTSNFQFFPSIDTICDSLLIFSEKDVVLNFDIFGLGEPELGHTKIMFDSSKLRFQAVDFPHIILDIMSCRRLLMKLAFGVLRTIGFIVTLRMDPICFRGAARKILAV